ncbi:BRI1 kinase inhibitor 1-like [Aristolochia californica]|uniref:BRI1 kinase inhibitor 1-like n=1 Tax=Aristolochia californica TaxID=171875 RepID=UPI0035D7135D
METQYSLPFKREKLQHKQGGTADQEVSTTNRTHPRSPPPSSSSSPSHEFSFTISLHPSTATSLDKCRPPPSFAIDLSPADEIFFHGHLLPLHLLSHPSISPRASTTSLDNLNLPIHELFDEKKPHSNANNRSSTITIPGANKSAASPSRVARGRTKAKSFSLFRFSKWRKLLVMGEREEEKKKVRLDVSRVLKRYARVVRPLLSFRGEKEKQREFRRQPHSFSGNLNSRWKEWGGRKKEFSDPASLTTSPTNNGLLVATATISSSNDSTIEELQSAIQAAIAYCKNSIAAEEKCKC